MTPATAAVPYERELDNLVLDYGPSFESMLDNIRTSLSWPSISTTVNLTPQPSWTIRLSKTPYNLVHIKIELEKSTILNNTEEGFRWSLIAYQQDGLIIGELRDYPRFRRGDDLTVSLQAFLSFPADEIVDELRDYHFKKHPVSMAVTKVSKKVNVPSLLVNELSYSPNPQHEVVHIGIGVGYDKTYHRLVTYLPFLHDYNLTEYELEAVVAHELGHANDPNFNTSSHHEREYYADAFATTHGYGKGLISALCSITPVSDLSLETSPQPSTSKRINRVKESIRKENL